MKIHTDVEKWKNNEFKTALNIGDTIYFLENNQIHEAIIEGIQLYFDERDGQPYFRVQYFMYNLSNPVEEKDAFTSPDELIKKHFMGKIIKHPKEKEY